METFGVILGLVVFVAAVVYLRNKKKNDTITGTGGGKKSELPSHEVEK